MALPPLGLGSESRDLAGVSNAMMASGSRVTVGCLDTAPETVWRS